MRTDYKIATKEDKKYSDFCKKYPFHFSIRKSAKKKNLVAINHELKKNSGKFKSFRSSLTPEAPTTFYAFKTFKSAYNFYLAVARLRAEKMKSLKLDPKLISRFLPLDIISGLDLGDLYSNGREVEPYFLKSKTACADWAKSNNGYIDSLLSESTWALADDMKKLVKITEENMHSIGRNKLMKIRKAEQYISSLRKMLVR